MRMCRAVVVPLLVAAAIAFGGSTASFSQIGVGISVSLAPPPLPIYEQPPIPGPGYIWTPGYWAWGSLRILLGTRHLGAPARGRRAVDARLLGLGRRWVYLSRRLLGPDSRFLRRNQLRFWLHRRRLRRRILVERLAILQSSGKQYQQYTNYECV